MMNYDAGRMEAAAERLSAAIEELTLIEDWAEVARAETFLSYIRYSQGVYDVALILARRGKTRAEQRGDGWMTVDALIAETNCLIDLGLFTEAIAAYERGVALCERLGHLHGLALCWCNIGLARLELGAWSDAMDALRRVLEAGDRTYMKRMLGFVEYYTGLVEEERGDLLAAADRFGRALAIRLRHGQEGYAIDALAGLLRAAIATGNYGKTSEHYAEIRKRIDARGIEGVEHTGRLYLALVRGSEMLGNGRTREYLDEAMAFLDERAGKVTDEAMRSSFLSNVRAHRELRELAVKAGISTQW